MADFDFTQRFIFDETDVRGEMASLEESYAHVLAKHTYPEPEIGRASCRERV